MNIRLFLSIGIFFLATGLGAETVMLKDGTSVKGKITKQKKGKFIALEVEGAERIIPWSQVDRVELEENHGGLIRVELADGTFIDGRQKTLKPGKVVILEVQGAERIIPWTQVNRVREVPTVAHVDSDMEGLTEEQKQKVKRFKEKGGMLLGVDLGANGTYMTMKIDTSGSKTGKAEGGGGGVGFGIPFYFLSAADTKDGKFSMFGLAAEPGFNYQFTSLSMFMDTSSSLVSSSYMTMDIKSQQFNAYFKLGFFLGSPHTPFSVGLFWKPTYSMQSQTSKTYVFNGSLKSFPYTYLGSSTSTSTSSSENANPGGVEVEFMFKSVNENLGRFIKDPIFKVYIFVLPSDKYLMVMGGAAIVSYW